MVEFDYGGRGGNLKENNLTCKSLSLPVLVSNYNMFVELKPSVDLHTCAVLVQ